MPFAGFESFDACVAEQLSNGKSQELANKICGALKRDHEKKTIEDQYAAVKSILTHLEKNNE